MMQPPITMTNRINNLVFLFLLVACSILCSSCGSAPKSGKKVSNSVANATPEITESDRELRAMRTADFDYIFTIKRKDGEPFDSPDKRFIKRKAYKANRKSLTRDGKILFIGSNYEIAKKSIEALKKRFEYEDFSKSDEQMNLEREKAANSNSNANEAANTNANN